MRLINIDDFLRREWLIHLRAHVDCPTKVLEFSDDETAEYAILSHRWIDPTEIDYEEMVDLGKMDRQQQDEIRGRQGYKKILDACKQAQTDGYEWMWVDTCCIDKRSSAELSEAINSMYRWYGNARVCYAYLHDVDGSFPTEEDDEKYPKSNGWPEWFSRGWTLQEMIAPQNLQFFNKDWQPIGNKNRLAETLEEITGVPQHILADGLEGNRPCVAQIIMWAANRTTTRVEDKAYSLMGLLDVNMPMLYGEGKKAFHRLQLEIIRSSNDQSIFARGIESSRVRIGSILADDPSDFEDCSGMRLMDRDGFIEKFPELSSTNADHFDVFPITNRGIQIWMLLHRYRNSHSVFKAYLPCWNADGDSVSIDLSCARPITIDVRQVGLVPLMIPLQSSAKCTSDINAHRTTRSHSISMTVDSSRMDSPAPMWTQRTSKETRSHSPMLTPSVSKPIAKNKVTTVLKSSLDNGWAWTGCT